jgi:cell division septation protein DedD
MDVAPVTPVAEIVVPEAPLFASPLKGPVYIQLGAVEKGMATLLTHGVRKLGYTAFVAQGDKATVFRVLVGPFKTG